MFEIWAIFVGFFEQIIVLFAVMTGSMALGIILFTVLARLTILPLTLKSIRSSREMQKIQPLMKELQRKHGKDQQKLNEEMLKLYREHKVNPVGGCLPLLFQMPIFLGVYQAIIHLMAPDQQQNLGAAMRAAIVDNDISQLQTLPLTGPLWEWQLTGQEDATVITSLLTDTVFGIINLGLPTFADNFSTFSGIAYLALPVTAIIFQFVQQVMAMPRVMDPQQKMMMQFMLFMPLMMGYIMVIVPMGTVLYWATSSLIGIIQQYFVSGWGSLSNYLRFLPPDPPGVQQRQEEQAALSAAATAAANNEDAGDVTTKPRRTFDDVLRPLIDGTAGDPVPALATSGGVAGDGDDGAATTSRGGDAPHQRQHVDRSSRARSGRKRNKR